MSDIKERLEKLIGKPSFAFCDNDSDKLENWSNWREALIDRLAENARVVYGDHDCYWAPEIDKKADLYSGVIIDIQPIRRGVTKSSIIAALYDPQAYDRVAMAEKIRSEGIIND